MTVLPSIHVQFFYSVFQTCSHLPLTSTEAHTCTHLASLLPAAVEYSGLISCSIFRTIMHATLSSLQAISMVIFASDLMSVRRAGGQCFCLLYQDFINWTISQAYHEICLCRWWVANQNIILHAWASVQARIFFFLALQPSRTDINEIIKV